VQEQHDLADDLLFSPAGDDPLRAFWADPGDFAQAAGLFCAITSNTASPKARTSFLA
jgi:hypothetical protein